VTAGWGCKRQWTGRASGQIVVVDACTNLASPVWFPLQTNTMGSDPLDFSDPD